MQISHSIFNNTAGDTHIHHERVVNENIIFQIPDPSSSHPQPANANYQATISMIAEAVNDVSDNKNQCLYLLQRCRDILHYIDRAYLNETPGSYHEALEKFKK